MAKPTRKRTSGDVEAHPALSQTTLLEKEVVRLTDDVDELQDKAREYDLNLEKLQARIEDLGRRVEQLEATISSLQQNVANSSVTKSKFVETLITLLIGAVFSLAIGNVIK